MIEVTVVIGNSGDGSNNLSWVVDPKVLERLEELADEGDETWGSGDGLQTYPLVFPDGFDLTTWFSLNYITPLTLGDIDYD